MGTSRFYNQNLSKYNENIYWWLRSSTTSDFAFVYEVEAEGHVDCFFSYNNHVGVRPALHLNLSSSNLYSYAGTVCSDAMKSGESGTDNPVNPSEPDESDTPNQPAHPDKPERPQEPEQRRAM